MPPDDDDPSLDDEARNELREADDKHRQRMNQILNLPDEESLDPLIAANAEYTAIKAAIYYRLAERRFKAAQSNLVPQKRDESN